MHMPLLAWQDAIGFRCCLAFVNTDTPPCGHSLRPSFVVESKSLLCAPARRFLPCNNLKTAPAVIHLGISEFSVCTLMPHVRPHISFIHSCCSRHLRFGQQSCITCCLAPSVLQLSCPCELSGCSSLLYVTQGRNDNVYGTLGVFGIACDISSCA